MPRKSKILLLALLIGGGAILLSKKASAQPSTSAQQLACESSGKFWYNDACHDTAPTICDCVKITNVNSPKLSLGQNTSNITVELNNGCTGSVDMFIEIYDFTVYDVIDLNNPPYLFDKQLVENIPITVPAGKSTTNAPIMTRIKNGVADLTIVLRRKDGILCDSVNFTNSSI